MHAQGTALPAGQGVSRRDQAADEPIAYTVAKVARLLGKHPNTVYEWVAKACCPTSASAAPSTSPSTRSPA